MTHSPSRITQLLDAHGLRPSRAFGQNFVSDPNTVRRIVRLAGIEAGERVVEIGPGLGSLTLALLEAGASVTAIEIDAHLIAPLQEVLNGTDANIVHADALDVDWSSLVPRDEPATVVANLPYNVGTIIVVRLLEEVPQVQRLVVMLQKEVAERLVAQPGSGAYGALSVKARYYAEPKMLGIVPPTVFVPKPDVESAIIELRRRETPPTDADPKKMFELVKAGFGQRRKMLRRSLAGRVTPEQFVCAGVEETQRAEELSVEQWGTLTKCVGTK